MHSICLAGQIAHSAADNVATGTACLNSFHLVVSNAQDDPFADLDAEPEEVECVQLGPLYGPSIVTLIDLHGLKHICVGVVPAPLNRSKFSLEAPSSIWEQSNCKSNHKTTKRFCVHAYMRLMFN